MPAPRPDLPAVFKALSHPHRLTLFLRLAKCCRKQGCSGEECTRLCVGELGKGLRIAPATLSHHLKELTRAGLVSTSRQGQQVQCWVAEETLTTLADFFLKAARA